MAGGGVGGMPVPTFAQALDAWNSGIDTPQIREVLGIGNQTEQMEVIGDYNTVVNNVKRALAGTNAASPSAWNAVVSLCEKRSYERSYHGSRGKYHPVKSRAGIRGD